ncbi:Hypothetical protein SFHH103_03386 [Sinorhizobium fredii HH103]|uniref:Transmembrane protein n=1 Tax=Sinorhizobium fredii (strain HH103) TaxID=1117943 RepID=G9A3D0_SINF1|nr:hypothetical protein [Sinorhizobium fredii]CCE97878.1 Hypothetical protein SFHH103_03386 [Sinorhizobium fredii HH103]
MDKAKAVERDLKRFDEATASFEKTALLLGFVNLFLAIWVRTSGLQINPGSAVGLGIAGFNVGYAIVFGPLIAVVSLAVLISLLHRRGTLRNAVTGTSGNSAHLSPGDKLALANYEAPGSDRVSIWVNRLWRGFWYFVIPPAAALVELLRYCDFVPSESAKAGGFWDRIGSLFFTTKSWEIRPILPDHALEQASNLMASLPYVYAPLQSWIELGLVLLSFGLAWHAARKYFN